MGMVNQLVRNFSMSTAGTASKVSSEYFNVGGQSIE